MDEHEFVLRCGKFLIFTILGVLPWGFNAYNFGAGLFKGWKEEKFILPFGGLFLSLSWWHFPWSANWLRMLCWLPFLFDGYVASLLIFLCRRCCRRRIKCRCLRSHHRKNCAARC